MVLRLSLVLLVLAGLVVWHPTLAQSLVDVRKLCPSTNPQILPFEATKIEVDSTLHQITKERSEAINCLQIVGATHEYYVDLVGSNLSNVLTQHGGYQAFNDPFVVRPTEYEPTVLYVGPNRNKYEVKILKEKSQIRMVVDNLVTWLLASLPTKRTDPEKNLQSVALLFQARDKGNLVELSFVDQEPDGPPILFRFAESTLPGISEIREKTFAIEKQTNGIVYPVPTGPKAIGATRIEFVDSDRFVLAAMELYLPVPASGQR